MNKILVTLGAGVFAALFAFTPAAGSRPMTIHDLRDPHLHPCPFCGATDAVRHRSMLCGDCARAHAVDSGQCGCGCEEGWDHDPFYADRHQLTLAPPPEGGGWTGDGRVWVDVNLKGDAL